MVGKAQILKTNLARTVTATAVPGPRLCHTPAERQDIDLTFMLVIL